MGFDLELAQHAATVALNLALAVAVGAGASWLSVGGLRSEWAARQIRGLRRAGLGALAVAMSASACVLWLEAAAMAEVPVTQAGAAAWSMLTATHLGVAWRIGIGALVSSMAAMAVASGTARARLAIAFSLSGLAVFLYTRSMVSHAAANGDVSLPMLADWLHLMLICLWVGEVFVSGFLILASPPAVRRDDRNDCVAYIESLSSSATFALVGIFATGLFSAWHNLGALSALVGNPYGTTLLGKLAVVAAAAMLGGANRFIVMPRLLAAVRGGSSAARAAARQFTAILRVESGVLLAVLIVAAMLSSTSPPTAG
jgi:putative copper resistance protein D